MTVFFDNDRDWFRDVVLLVCIASFVGLLFRRFRPPNDEWNPKTKDYWFALLLFSLSGAAATFESIVNNQSYSIRLSLTFIAALVCINGLLRKGRWRGDGK